MRILDAAIHEERLEWEDLWASWPAREVFAHPDYVGLYVEKTDRAVCAIWKDSRCSILYPFILRKILITTDFEAFDITSPYGYGGCYLWNAEGEKKKLARQFWDEFDSWAHNVGIVSQFTRLHLFPKDLLPFRGQVETIAPNVVRNLDLEPENIWMDYKHKVRKNINKARRFGIKVVVDLTGEYLDDFLCIYEGTMRRCNAKKSYFFPRHYFESIIKKLPEHFAFFHAFHGERIVSTELVLISETHLYSFLGGTDASFFDLRPNDLLKHTIIEWGISRGKKNFVLGGGYGKSDGIFRYKLALAPHGEVPFKVGRRIYDQRIYDSLIESKRAIESSKGNPWNPLPDFFPAYRA